MHSRSYDVRSGRSMVGARGTRPPLPLFWLKNRIAEVRKADRARDKKPGNPPPPPLFAQGLDPLPFRYLLTTSFAIENA